MLPIIRFSDIKQLLSQVDVDVQRTHNVLMQYSDCFQPEQHPLIKVTQCSTFDFIQSTEDRLIVQNAFNLILQENDSEAILLTASFDKVPTL